jgi:hypothetical protein
MKWSRLVLPFETVPEREWLIIKRPFKNGQISLEDTNRPFKYRSGLVLK